MPQNTSSNDKVSYFTKIVKDPSFLDLLWSKGLVPIIICVENPKPYIYLIAATAGEGGFQYP